jgi:hypothetical protein
MKTIKKKKGMRQVLIDSHETINKKKIIDNRNSMWNVPEFYKGG